MVRPAKWQRAVALRPGLQNSFKDARLLVVAGERRGLVDAIRRLGIADVGQVCDVEAARALCDLATPALWYCRGPPPQMAAGHD
jgi:hypothetical protein